MMIDASRANSYVATFLVVTYHKILPRSGNEIVVDKVLSVNVVAVRI